MSLSVNERIQFVLEAENAYSQEFSKFRATSKRSFQSAGKGADSLTKKMGGVRTALGALGGLYFAGALINQIGTLEEGWISVAKTTGLVGGELEDLKDGIRNMSVEMQGVSIEEFQKIAKIAGQLGVKGSADIQNFTRVTAMMGVSTNLSVEQSAESFAQMGNILKEPIENFEIMGSVINELSNNSVATASDITDLTQRMGGAAETLELTTAEVLGISATLKDMGVSSEVGGTAMSQVFQKMLTDTEAFARVAGLNVEDFAEKVNTKPIEALKSLLSQMGKLGKFGAADALGELGLEGVRVGGVLLKLSGGVDKLEENLGRANTEYDTGTSLQTEYAVASESLFAQTTSVSNAMKILSEEVGVTLLPAIKEILPEVLSLVSGFSDLGKGLGIIAAKLTGATDPFKDNLEDAKNIVIDLEAEVQTLADGGVSNLNKLIPLEVELKRARLDVLSLMKIENAGLETTRQAQLTKNNAIKEEINLKNSLAGGSAGGGGAPEVHAKSETAINNLILANEKLGASKEKLIEIQLREFSLNGANFDQYSQFAVLLAERHSIEQEMAANKNAVLEENLNQEYSIWEMFYGKRKIQEDAMSTTLMVNAEIHAMAEQARANIVGVAYRGMENAALQLLETGKLSLSGLGQLVAQQTKIQLLGIAIQSGVQAVYQYALGLGATAMFGPGPPASIYFASAATHVKTAALAGGGAVAIQGVFGGGATRQPAGGIGGDPIRTTDIPQRHLQDGGGGGKMEVNMTFQSLTGDWTYDQKLKAAEGVEELMRLGADNNLFVNFQGADN